MPAIRADFLKTGEIPNPSLQLTWEDVGLKDEITNEDLHTLTGGLGFPIFFWWTRDKERQEANNNLHAEARYRETILPLIERRRNLAAGSRELYAAGEIVYRDLLQAERDYHQAQFSAVDAWKERLATQWQAECTLNPDVWRNIGGEKFDKKHY